MNRQLTTYMISLTVIVVLIQILVDTSKPRLSRQMDHYPSGWLPSLGHAKATVADLPTGWTHPALVMKNFTEVLTITIQQTWATELSTHTPAVFVVADGLCIKGLLATLVTCGSIDAVIDFVCATLNSTDALAIICSFTV